MNRLTTKFTITSLLIVSVVGVLRLRLDKDLLSLLPTGNPLVKDYKDVIKKFNPLDKLYIDLSSTAEGPEELIAAGDELTAKMKKSGLFHQISYRWSPDEVMKTIQVMRKHRAALTSAHELRQMQEKLSLNSIQGFLKSWKKTLMESPAPMLSKSFYQDPIGLDEHLYHKLSALQSMGNSLKNFQGRLFSSDLKHLLIIASPNEPASNGSFTATINDFMSQQTTRVRKSQVNIAWLGGHRYAYANETEMKSDVGTATSLSLIGIIFLASLVFRRRLLPLLIIFPVAAGASLAFGLISWFYNPMSLVAIGCGSILFGIAVDYGLHLLFHIDQETQVSQESIYSHVQFLRNPLLLSAATTLGAFLCLQVSLLPSYRQFGAFAALGILGSVLATLFLLPKVALRLRPTAREPILNLSPLLLRYFRFAKQHKFGIWIFLFALTSFGLAGTLRTRFDGELKNLYSSSEEIKQDMQTINQSFGDAMSSTSIITTGANLEGALQSNDQLADYLELTTQRQGSLVSSYHTLANFLPSRSRQLERIKQWKNFWTEARLSSLKQNLKQAAIEQGIKFSIFEEFLRGITKPQPVISIKAYDNTSLATLFETQMNRSTQSVSLLANVKMQDKNNFPLLKKKIETQIVDSKAMNAGYFVAQMVNLINEELLKLGAASLFVISALLALFYGIRNVLPLLTPLILSLVWTFGAMGWLGIGINFMNCVIVLFVFGLVIDYAVFLNAALNPADSPSDQRLGCSAGAILISALTTLAGVGALAIASHPALHSIGITTLLGISAGLLAVFLVLPSTVGQKSP